MLSMPQACRCPRTLPFATLLWTWKVVSVVLASVLTLPLLAGLPLAHPPAPVTLASLVHEMVSADSLALFPSPTYDSLQASSYNRASVHRDQPGWYADSDGVGFLRTETRGTATEWVIMEHTGPGCLTRIWTPFFYFDLADNTGPNIRVYLDGASEPVIDESLIHLVSAKSFVQPPFASFTARAGNLYLPIPFGSSCKITLSAKPFYHLINYRAYPPGTKVESFSQTAYETAGPLLKHAGETLYQPPRPNAYLHQNRRKTIRAGGSMTVRLPRKTSVIREFTLRLPQAVHQRHALRSTVLEMTFDQKNTVWCPVGDFFSCPDSIHPFQTWQRRVSADGTFSSRWSMPYRESATLRVLNLGPHPIDAEVEIFVDRWLWHERSMHFHASWRPDDIAPGTPFQDWNFIDIQGRGVYVGDAWTVLNPQKNTWWGEGDEKIYVDDAWDRGFPTHFGTGTEDYYGWAGGLVPTRQDEFDEPFLANVRVGGVDGHTQGYNICTRTRALDAIPFQRRLRFDMESSFGTDIRNPWNLLGYSAVTFWYAEPGATSNRPPMRREAARPILSLPDLEAASQDLHTRPGHRR
jgi:hypothetical protein